MPLKENIQKKLAARRAAKVPNLTCVSYKRKGLSLHITTADKRLWVVPWAQLYGADHQAQAESEYIHIVTRLYDVTIEGKNLEQLAILIGRHEVESVQAGNAAACQAKPFEPFIRQVTVVEKIREVTDEDTVSPRMSENGKI